MNELFAAGVELMLVGMGIVFLFLALLVATVNLMAFVIQRYAPDPLPTETDQPPSSPSQDEIIAAITVAVRRYWTDK
jgi:oxaloacetate decarboxylase (Na+ extruding) subunit gamma